MVPIMSTYENNIFLLIILVKQNVLIHERLIYIYSETLPYEWVSLVFKIKYTFVIVITIAMLLSILN